MPARQSCGACRSSDVSICTRRYSNTRRPERANCSLLKFQAKLHYSSRRAARKCERSSEALPSTSTWCTSFSMPVKKDCYPLAQNCEAGASPARILRRCSLRKASEISYLPARACVLSSAHRRFERSSKADAVSRDFFNSCRGDSCTLLTVRLKTTCSTRQRQRLFRSSSEEARIVLA
jgi:hypothetical protein